MAVPVSNGSTKRPSERAIAFAVSIVLSKPEGLTVREYVKLLRQHVAKGRRENAISSVYRHLDQSSYWRSEYERLKDVLKVTECETVDLKREVDTLKSKLNDTRPASPTKKRKKPDEDVIPVPRSPKKPKHEGLPVKGPLSAADQAFDFASVGEVGNILMRSLFQAQAVLRSHHRTEPAVLAHHLIRAASALPQIVQRAMQHRTPIADPGIDTLKNVLTGTSRAIFLLITGYNRLSHVADGIEIQGQVIYAYIQMYQKLLHHFADASKSEASRLVAPNAASTIEQKQSPVKGKPKPAKAPSPRESPLLNVMTNFLCNIIENLDSKNEAHKALFEGLTYVVLEQLGPRLYLVVFGHCRPDSIEKEIAILAPPSVNGVELQRTIAEEEVCRAAKLEAPYLVRLLNQLMSAAPAHLGATTSMKTGKAKQASNKGSSKGALAIVAKERLQRTLVNCMFGTEGIDDSDPFKDCLKMPAISGTALPMPKVKEADVQDWFKEEIWRLLGWEILSREADW